MARKVTGTEYLAYAGLIHFGPTLSMSGQFCPEVANQTHPVMSQSAAAGVAESIYLWSRYSLGSNRIQSIYEKSTTYLQYFVNAVTVTLGVWRALSSSSSAPNTGRIYMSNVYGPGTLSQSGTPGAMTATTGTTRIGAHGQPGVTFFGKGQFSENAIWSAMLTADQHFALGANFCSMLVSPPTLKAYWPLGGAYGNQDRDRVADAHMTPISSPTWTDNHPKTIYPCECLCC